MPDVGRAPEPWERQTGETAKAYQHFVKYREMDPIHRSLRRLAAELDRGPEQLFTWSKKWGWSARVTAWDEHCDEQSRTAQLARLRHAGEVRVDVVLAGLGILRDRLVGRDGVIDKETGEIVSEAVKPIDPSRLDAKDLAALGGVLTKMQVMAEEAAGLKSTDETKPIDIRLSFAQAPMQIGAEHGIIQAGAKEIEAAPIDRSLVAGEDDTRGNTE